MQWAYLGHLGPGGKLDWGGSHSGNIPTSGLILPDNFDSGVDRKIRELARDGEYNGCRVDWGAYAIKVNGPELLAVLASCYGDLDAVRPASVAGQYVAYARNLGETKYVAFVSVEL